MKLLARLCCALAVWSVPSAPAQAKPPSHKQLAATSVDVQAYADCVVKRRASMARQAIAANADQNGILKKYPSLIIDDCASSLGVVTIKFPGETYLYGLAEGVFKTDFASVPPPNVADIPLLDHHPKPQLDLANVKPGSAKAKDMTRQYEIEISSWIMAHIGECVVRENPAASKALLMSIPGKPPEAEAFTAIRQVLPTCLPANQTMRMSLVQLRGAVALAYVRLGAKAQEMTHA